LRGSLELTSFSNPQGVVRDLETDPLHPTPFLYPPVNDPDPGRNWDKYIPPKYKVAFRNFQLLPVQWSLNDEIFQLSEGVSCHNDYIAMCQNETRYPNVEDRRLCEIYNQEILKNEEVTKDKEFRKPLTEVTEWKHITLTERNSL
jgi:hypothetical protein